MLRRFFAQRKLAASLKPRPDLRDRRFNTWSMERRQRYLKAVEGLYETKGS
jgi:hypothetical protein